MVSFGATRSRGQVETGIRMRSGHIRPHADEEDEQYCGEGEVSGTECVQSHGLPRREGPFP